MSPVAKQLAPTFLDGWGTMQLRHASTCLDGRRVPLNVEQRSRRQGDYPYWGANGVVDSIDEYLFDEPLVLIGEDGAPFFDSTRPVAFFVTGKIWVNNHIHVLRVGRNFDPRFVTHCLNATDYGPYIEGSTRDKLTQEKMGSIRLPSPPLPHQRAIADYLDRETARLDALVAAKERLLGLLDEKRRALITRAVTRGLDPNVPLRDSGIPWLGEISAHWKVTRLKFVASVQTGIALGKSFGNKPTREYPYLRVANVQDGYLDLTEVKSISVPDEEASLCHLRAGDVLMNEGGDADKLGRGAIWTGQINPCLHQNHVFAVRPRRISPEWLNSWTSSDIAKAYFESRAKQSTNLASISASNLSEMPLLKPPDQEQKGVVEHVTRYTAKIDSVRKATKRTIALLKERRAALIAAAVIGQVDIKTSGATQSAALTDNLGRMSPCPEVADEAS